MKSELNCTSPDILKQHPQLISQADCNAKMIMVLETKLSKDINYTAQHAPFLVPSAAPSVSTEDLFRFEGTSMAGFPSKKSAGFM